MMTRRDFGSLPDGRRATCYTLTNSNGLSASFLDYGATWQAMMVPGRDGKLRDVVLGYDTAGEYAAGQMYLGVTVGRVANRIAGARFSLGGREYRLCANEGTACSHGGRRGFDKKLWGARPERDAVTFTLLSPDGEEGFPGDLTAMLRFTLTDDALSIRYFAACRRDTVVNLTNHAYFNLSGQGEGSVLGHKLWIDADRVTRIGPDIVPTGEIASVLGGPLDFTRQKPIGRDIGAAAEQMDAAGGYDHNFVLKHPRGGVELFARAISEQSGVVLEAYTDQPGVQLYTPADLGGMRGKNGASYGVRPAFCLETQHFHDAVHHPQFPSTLLRAGAAFTSETVYRFRAAAR